MRRADVPTQRRPRQRQVSQGMREGKGRTTADATSVGVGAIGVLHPSPGPSIADPKPNKQNEYPTPTTQQPLPHHSRLAHPSFPRSRESIPPEQPPPTPQLSLAPLRYSLSSTQYQTTGRGRRCSSFPLSLPPSTKLEGSACAMAQALPSVFSSPSPLRALRERGIKGVRVPPSRFLKQSKPCLKPQNNQRPPTRNPQKFLQASFNQTSYEFNQSSINVQSKTHNRIKDRRVARPVCHGYHIP